MCIKIHAAHYYKLCVIHVTVCQYIVHIHTHTHTLCTASGEVFTWGSGSYGRLGHGHLRDRFSPLMIGGVLRGVGITFIACHEFHSVAVAGERKRGKGRGREGERERERERESKSISPISRWR